MKGKPQASFPRDAAALVSRPELMNSLCQQGFAPTLPVPPVHPCMQQCRKTLPFGRVTQWLRASGCHPFWSRIPQLYTEMVLFTVRDLLGEKGTRGAQKQIKIFLNRGKKIKKGRSLWGREVKFSCSAEGEQEHSPGASQKGSLGGQGSVCSPTSSDSAPPSGTSGQSSLGWSFFFTAPSASRNI